jgi:hypothetical protein
MHINKNAGTTMRHLLRKNYPAGLVLEIMLQSRKSTDGRPKTVDGLDEDVYEAIAEVQYRQSALGCVAANLPFGLHRFLERPLAYFTFLREPVSRCISYWYFAYENRQTSALWTALQSYDFNIPRICQDRAAYQFSNDQIRMVTGTSACEPGQTEFELAQEIIESQFLLAGAIEHFDPCLRVLARHFGWNDITYARQNTRISSDPSLLPAHAEKNFRDANEWDIRLYEWLVNDYLPRRLP